MRVRIDYNCNPTAGPDSLEPTAQPDTVAASLHTATPDSEQQPTGRLSVANGLLWRCARAVGVAREAGCIAIPSATHPGCRRDGRGRFCSARYRHMPALRQAEPGTPSPAQRGEKLRSPPPQRSVPWIHGW